jgi:hypothetical protein
MKRLIEELGERFKKGMLQTLPETAAPSNIDTPALQALAELIGFPADCLDLICSDDRFVNGFNHRDDKPGVPIITLGDILDHLAKRGFIDRARIWRIRHELRATNCRFIPSEPEEIVHHLIDAAARDGSVLETPELRVMRQYMAACLAQGGILQRVGSPVGQVGVMGFPIGLRKAVVEALALIWATQAQSDEARLARVNWLIESVYFDYSAIFRAIGAKRSLEDERQFVAMSAATLMLLNIESDAPAEGHQVVPANLRRVDLE